MNIKEIKGKVIESGDFMGGLIALVSKVEQKVTAANKPYLRCVLQDKTGELELSKWNATDADKEILKAGSIVQFSGLGFNLYNGDVTAKTSGTSTFTETMGSPDDFRLTITPSVSDLKDRFVKHYESITDPELKVILSKIVKPRYAKFKDWPAAEHCHHDVRHGLIYHTVGILDLVEAICSLPNYQNSDVDVQLIKTAAMLHDIGKIDEYAVDDEYNGKLCRAALKGHIVIGAELVHDLYREGLICEELELSLSHILLAHHGKKEFGSPVLPATLNAFILHTADNLDAKTYSYRFNSLELGEGEYAQNGVFDLDKVRLYRSSWHSRQNS